MSENSIEFSLSNSEQRDSWLNSSHRALDADTLNILNGKHLRKSSQVKNPKYHTSISLFVEHMYISLMKFTQINLYYALN